MNTGRTFAQIRQLITESQLSDWVKAEGRGGLPAHRRGGRQDPRPAAGAGAFPRGGRGGFDRGHRRARASRWRCWASRACWRARWSKAPAGSTARTGASRFPRPRRWRFWARAASRCRNATNRTSWSRPPGAALLAELVESFGPMRGAGGGEDRLWPGHPRQQDPAQRAARRARGTGARGAAVPSRGAAAHDWETDTIAVLETNLDDINAEILGSFVEQALAAGALDVFHTPIQMKKNRPGRAADRAVRRGRCGQVRRDAAARDQHLRRPPVHGRAAQAAARVCRRSKRPTAR